MNAAESLLSTGANVTRARIARAKEESTILARGRLIVDPRPSRYWSRSDDGSKNQEAAGPRDLSTFKREWAKSTGFDRRWTAWASAAISDDREYLIFRNRLRGRKNKKSDRKEMARPFRGSRDSL